MDSEHNHEYSQHNPGGIAVDASGDIYLDAQNYPVTKFMPWGTGYISSSIGTGLGSFLSVAVDREGDIFIADVLNRQLIKETPIGNSYTKHGIVSCA